MPESFSSLIPPSPPAPEPSEKQPRAPEEQAELIAFIRKTEQELDEAERANDINRINALIAQMKQRSRMLDGIPEEATPPELQESLKSWQTLYREVFALDLDISTIKIPEKKEGFDRLIVVAEKATPSEIFTALQKLFLCTNYSGQDLDSTISDRDPNKDGSYAIWIKDTIEADEDLKNLSADQLADKGIKGITLLERLILEAKYFKETGKHLDINNWTLCNGARYSGGFVPDVNWRGGKLSVGRCTSDDAHGYLRARAVVS